MNGLEVMQLLKTYLDKVHSEYVLYCPKKAFEKKNLYDSRDLML